MSEGHNLPDSELHAGTGGFSRPPGSASRLPEDPTELAGFGSLELIARQLVEGLMIGRHRSPFKGSSVEFVEHREYSPGDEVRHIDWRAFGKTGRYYVREFEDETSLRALLILDGSASMRYCGSTVSKFVYARMLTASLAWLLLTQRDAVGLHIFDAGHPQPVPPSGSRTAFHRILDALNQATPAGESSIAGTVESLLPALPSRSLMIVISDCLEDPESLNRAFQRCRHARHDVIIFRIVTPEEEEFPFERPTQFRNLENQSDRLLVDPVRLRREYLAQYRQFSDQLEQQFGAIGIDYQVFRTDKPLQQSLGNWLAERLTRRRKG